MSSFSNPPMQYTSVEVSAPEAPPESFTTLTHQDGIVITIKILINETTNFKVSFNFLTLNIFKATAITNIIKPIGTPLCLNFIIVTHANEYIII